MNDRYFICFVQYVFLRTEGACEVFSVDYVVQDLNNWFSVEQWDTA